MMNYPIEASIQRLFNAFWRVVINQLIRLYLTGNSFWQSVLNHIYPEYLSRHFLAAFSTE